MSIYNDIAQVYGKKGYNVVVGTHFDRVQVYLSWYRGNVNDFHYYNIDGANGNAIRMEKKTLSMAKTACEDFASLEFNENSRVIVENNKDADKVLQDVLEDNDFNLNITDLLETSKALGDGYTVEYLANGKIKLDFINADNAMITAFDNYKVKGLVLISKKKMGRYHVTHLQHCLFTAKEDGTNEYSVTHEVYRSTMKDGLGKKYELQKCNIFTDAELDKLRTVIKNEKTGETEVVYRATFPASVPFFQRFRPNVKNNFDLESPYGMSRYGNAIDVLKSIDNAYDAYDTEFENGRSRIMVDSKLMRTTPNVDPTNQTSFVKYFNAKERVYQGVAGLANANGGDKVVIYNPTIREADISQGINNNLSLFGFKFMGAKNMYEFKNGIVQKATATQVKVDDNDKWIKIESDRKITANALEGMALAILHLAKENGTYNGSVDDLNIKVIFDDSVLIDDEEEYRKAHELLLEGNKPLRMFLIDNVGLSEEDADKWIEELSGEKDADIQRTITNFANPIDSDETEENEEMENEVGDE